MPGYLQIVQRPQYVTPSDNPIVFLFRQDASHFVGTTEVVHYNRSIVIEVTGFTNGFSGTIGTYEIFETLDGRTSYFDVSPIVAPFVVSQVLKPYNSNFVMYDPTGTFYLTLKVSNKFSTTIDGTATVDETITTEEFSIFKGCLTRTDFINWNFQNKKKSSANTYKNIFLTDYPLTVVPFFPGLEYKVKKEDDFSISWIDNSYPNIYTDYKGKFFLFQNGTFLNSFTVTFTAGNQGTLGAVYINLQRLLTLGLITQTQKDNTTELWFALQNSAESEYLSPFLKLNYIKDCKENGYSLRFMNRYGMFDYFHFNFNKRFSGAVKGLEYTKKDGYFDFENDVYKFSNENAGRISYIKQITKKLELSSNWLTEKIQNWLIQIYESPFVFICEGDKYENVIITSSSYSKKQDEYDELFNEIVEIEYTENNSINL